MQIDIEAEKKEILNRYKNLIKACKRRLEKGDKEIIRKAFEVSVVDGGVSVDAGLVHGLVAR